MNGYLHSGYPQALSHIGTPRKLPRCGGWVLERKIPDTMYHDAMGCYPLFACRNWSELRVDLEDAPDHIVSLALVTDPFGEYDEHYLRRCFPDTVQAFKEHFVIDLNESKEAFVNKHHQRYAKKALKSVDVELCKNPSEYIDDWVSLYGNLIERRRIRGIPAFPRQSFIVQLRVPGIVALRAAHEDRTIGMLLWFIQGDRGYYHLGAFSDSGYQARASFALFWRAIEHFTGLGLRWLSLGSGAGVHGDKTDGLTRFKRGWATGTRTAFFCGRIIDRAAYAEISKAKGMTAGDYFPAYREGEFT